MEKLGFFYIASMRKQPLGQIREYMLTNLKPLIDSNEKQARTSSRETGRERFLFYVLFPRETQRERGGGEFFFIFFFLLLFVNFL